MFGTKPAMGYNPRVDTMTVVLFVLGLGLLIVGAELLVRGASRIAVAVGISPLVVGLTVVALGTSSPEIAVSLMAAARGQGDLALGNVVGSNIFNILLVLGACAAIAPMVVAQKLVRFDVPVLILASLALIGLAWDGRIDWLDGALLFIGLIAYNLFVIRQSRRETKRIREEYEQEYGAPPEEEAQRRGTLLKSILLVAAGFALLTVGSHFLVQGAVAIATWLGVSELVIGLTVVAAGTGLPEAATSIVAALRGQRDMAVGNIVGSNIYNILGVMGLAGLISPGGVPVAESAFQFDLPVALACAVACLPVFFSGNRIARWEGVMFLAYYAAYVGFVVMSALRVEAITTFSNVMLGFVIPLTAVTIGVVSWRAWRARASAR